jgi:hypothetical protein
MISQSLKRALLSLSGLISLSWLMAALLVACGPGTGGTGTGPEPTSQSPVLAGSTISYTGIAPLPLSGIPTPAATPIPGSTCTALCGTGTGTTSLSLQLQSQSIALHASCANFSYSGPWSISAQGEVNVEGRYETVITVNGQPSTSSQAARLNLLFDTPSADSSAVTITLRKIQGIVLLGPVRLDRGAAAINTPVAGGC